MRSYVVNLMPATSALDMAASSCIPGSSTPASGARYPSISLPYVASSSLAPISPANPNYWQTVEYGVGYNVSLAFNGIQPQGYFQILSTNDYIYGTPIAGTSTPIGVGLPGSSAATGSSGILTYNVDRAYYKAIQVQFVPTTSSTGTLVAATYSSKGWA